ncbi:hypothetical protein ACFQDN_19210 [Pseudomonas asuensis]|jgi:hypothetical protein|uniref:Uncharacterized protein n=1 Tax=Pseudomonas asuensis TaxID=1825787 RepID=A0ABQ2GFP9_9PSED|nr:hypothetical protein [Pseudomonas asuensis]GGL93706.1 hypothetical protein GCM10009425_00830 [Pseudomonas asuensis]
MSLAEVTLSNARERLNPSELEEASATDIIETIKKPKVQASLTLCDSLLSHLISSQLHLQDAKALVKEAV